MTGFTRNLGIRRVAFGGALFALGGAVSMLLSGSAAPTQQRPTIVLVEDQPEKDGHAEQSQQAQGVRYGQHPIGAGACLLGLHRADPTRRG